MLKFISILQECKSEGSVNLLYIKEGQDTKIVYTKFARTPRVLKNEELSFCFVSGIIVIITMCFFVCLFAFWSKKNNNKKVIVYSCPKYFCSVS